jgi:hypothetical protein
VVEQREGRIDRARVADRFEGGERRRARVGGTLRGRDPDEPLHRARPDHSQACDGRFAGGLVALPQGLQEDGHLARG